MTRLSEYLLDTSNLLRDSNYLFNSKTSLARYINQARTQVAIQTGCIRCLINGQAPFGNQANPGQLIPGAGQPGSALFTTFSTIAGVEKYSYGYGNPLLRAANQGVKGIIDVIDVAISWGSMNPVLNWMPWEDLESFCRSYSTGVFSYPLVWSTNGDGTKGQVWLFPVPQITAQAVQGSQGQMSWDVTCLPEFIYSDDDYEAIPEAYSGAVKYYAAMLSFLGSQRFGMAEIMKDHFNEHLGISRVASDRGKTTNVYGW